MEPNAFKDKSGVTAKVSKDSTQGETSQVKHRVVFLHSHTLTERLYKPEHLERMRRVAELHFNPSPAGPSPEEAARLLSEAEVCVTSWGCPCLTEQILAAAPRLRLIIHAAGTVKGIVSDAVWERGIRVTSGAPALAVGVAETALGLMIASLKNMWELSQLTRRGGWNGPERNRVREVYGITVGVVGAGHAGQHFIKLLQNFEVEVLVYDPVRSAEEIAALGGKKVELEELLRRSDVVSVHAPALPQTRHMFNRETFRLMKDDAIFINTARGWLVNEEDLVQELQKGRFWACIDVTDPEPPAPDSPLRTLPNVTLLPHIAGSVNNGLYRLGRYVAEEVERYAAGEPAVNEVRREQLATLA